MALRKDMVIEAGTLVSGLGPVDGHLKESWPLAAAYIRITKVDCGKHQAVAYAEVRTPDASARVCNLPGEPFAVTHGVTAGGPLDQGYLHLKTLAAYAGAEDC